MKRVLTGFIFSLMLSLAFAVSGLAAVDERLGQDKKPEKPVERDKPKDDKGGDKKNDRGNDRGGDKKKPYES